MCKVVGAVFLGWVSFDDKVLFFFLATEWDYRFGHGRFHDLPQIWETPWLEPAIKLRNMEVIGETGMKSAKHAPMPKSNGCFSIWMEFGKLEMAGA